ncbi:hypothetical protein IO99_12390 [Clostridium sulfidigenes]|uniref:Uncharacterized protein n=1 Tax=Clostridium sulfidigenes TaxID=318464 RepID=A0A084JAE3_9CLOT|nr:hypothetical protein [Clostridium sulfidigenes]KEZ85927.1 hypothetical protein IO99_12390 [Clostridium sulfidigenes]HBA02834.1 hypothetical protein [Clostridium sp.]
MSKSNKKNKKNNEIKPSQKSTIDQVQILNRDVQDAHHIESATLINGLFGVEIKDNLIDPDTRFYI